MLVESNGGSTLAGSMRPELLVLFPKYGSIIWVFISKVDGDNRDCRSLGKVIVDTDLGREFNGRA